jgi:hypothetical protein
LAAACRTSREDRTQINDATVFELSRETATRYHKIAHDPAAIERLFVTLFLEAHKTPPKQIILDLDATDDPLHGHQEGRFFHGYIAICRCTAAGREAAAREHRWLGWRRRGDCSHRGADSRALAQGCGSFCGPTVALRATRS